MDFLLYGVRKVWSNELFLVILFYFVPKSNKKYFYFVYYSLLYTNI